MKKILIAASVGLALCTSAMTSWAQGTNFTCKSGFQSLNTKPAQMQCEALANDNQVSASAKGAWVGDCVNYANQWDACMKAQKDPLKKMLECNPISNRICSLTR